MEKVFNFLFGSVRSTLTTIGLLIIIIVSFNPQVIIEPMKVAAGNIGQFLGELFNAFGPLVITVFLIALGLKLMWQGITKKPGGGKTK